MGKVLFVILEEEKTQASGIALSHFLDICYNQHIINLDSVPFLKVILTVWMCHYENKKYPFA